MGYRSDIVIGIHKTILARHLIAPEIPKWVLEEKHTIHDDAVYYKLSGWKWYASYPEVAAIEAWFAELTAEMEDLPEEAEVKFLFGALRIAEDDTDVQQWGDPYEFDISLNRSIDYPMEVMNAVET
jgi:hypothetical protein